MIKNRSIKKIYYLGIFVILFIGYIYRNGRIYLYSNGVIEEDKITFGLTKLLKIENAPFYELNLFYTSVFISVYIVIILKLNETSNKQNNHFKKLNILTICMFLITILTPVLNYESILEINPNLKPYSFRFLRFLDDSILTSFRIRINLSTEEFIIMLYSFGLGMISLFLMIAMNSRIININKNADVSQIIDN